MKHDSRAFGHALLRGRYMAAAGIVENSGIPVDLIPLQRLRRHWDRIKRGLIEAVDGDFDIYKNGSFVEARFAAYLAKHAIPWPRLPSGRLCLDEDVPGNPSPLHSHSRRRPTPPLSQNTRIAVRPYDLDHKLAPDKRASGAGQRQAHAPAARA